MSREKTARETPAYVAWCKMKTRCDNANYHAYYRYGGRGISYCQAWTHYSNFYLDMGDPPEGFTLDRLDNDADYSPENCQWIPRVENSSKGKLNIRKVRLIKGLLASRAPACSKTLFHLTIAPLFGVHYRTIQDIDDGKSWVGI